MSETVSVNIPSGIQTPEQERQVTQKALLDLQRTNNANATAPAVLVHLPSAAFTDVKSTGSASYVDIPGYSWTINSRGGLVDIDAVITGTITDSDVGNLALGIDGKTMMQLGAYGIGSGAIVGFENNFRWRTILGKGQHVIKLQYKTTGGTISVNGTGRGTRTSTASIIEFPSNISNIDVSSK